VSAPRRRVTLVKLPWTFLAEQNPAISIFAWSAW
jgi:hypothetical protein